MTEIAPPETAPQMAQRLEDFFRSFDRVVVAYSGGVDSTVVLKAASNVLGDRAAGILADTESNTDEDIELARRIAGKHGLTFEIIAYSELAIENYADNPVNRCYFCKSELYTRLNALAHDRGYAVICDGSNADDVGDWRPGLQAVAENRVRSPLKECGLAKDDVRAIARHYGLPNHDRPSSPCLSSRIPYGQAVTREKLDQVAAGERILRGLGLSEFRCRHHGDVARIEAPPAEFEVLLAAREQVVRDFRSIGFHWVALDLGGFQSGNLNRVHLERHPTENKA